MENWFLKAAITTIKTTTIVKIEVKFSFVFLFTIDSEGTESAQM